jgi:hypothetical protein
MTKLKKGLPDVPGRMAGLPVDARGYPVPKFVAWMRDGKPVKAGQGEPDFRVIQPGWMGYCIQHKACWLCGKPLGRHKVFVIGPMCVVNRTSGEPPCHLKCAQFAAQACPFMTNPLQRRNSKDLDKVDGAFHESNLPRNPGATALYVTTDYKWLVDAQVIRMGAPHWIDWWCKGRHATRAEVEASIESGLPLLEAEKEGPAAVAALAAMVDRVRTLWLPR